MFFLNINKPLGLTSFDCIRELRKKLKIRAIGHSGTLDPLATGVLQVAVGCATKLLDYLDGDKTYVATLKFGYITDTFDKEGEEKPVKKPDFNKEELLKVLNSFIGKTSQIPPKYSAIKVDGKKLCDLARKNNLQNIEIKSREIEIYSIKLLEFNSFEDVKIEVCCKKGTYIRSLANDIGQILGCGAYLTSLKRIQAGNFKIEFSNNLDDDEFNQINPLDVLNFKKLELSDEEIILVQNGNFIKNTSKLENQTILLTKNNKLVSIANVLDNFIRPKKIFKENL